MEEIEEIENGFVFLHNTKASSFEGTLKMLEEGLYEFFKFIYGVLIFLK